jgi:hypothetical protein
MGETGPSKGIQSRCGKTGKPLLIDKSMKFNFLQNGQANCILIGTTYMYENY